MKYYFYYNNYGYIECNKWVCRFYMNILKLFLKCFYYLVEECFLYLVIVFI